MLMLAMRNMLTPTPNARGTPRTIGAVVQHVLLDLGSAWHARVLEFAEDPRGLVIDLLLRFAIQRLRKRTPVAYTFLLGILLHLLLLLFLFSAS